MSYSKPKFFIGQIIHHKLYNYRGVIIDVDPDYQGTEEWYMTMATSKPPKDEPWYHVLVHNATHRTYVAEQNIEDDPSKERIDHPELENYFSGGLSGGRYISGEKMN